MLMHPPSGVWWPLTYVTLTKMKSMYSVAMKARDNDKRNGIVTQSDLLTRLVAPQLSVRWWYTIYPNSMSSIGFGEFSEG